MKFVEQSYQRRQAQVAFQIAGIRKGGEENLGLAKQYFQPLRINIRKNLTRKKLVIMGTMMQSLENYYNKMFEEPDGEYLTKDYRKTKARVNSIEDSVEDLAVLTRRNNIVVHGVPIQRNERAGDLAIRLSEIVGMKVWPDEIDIAYRLLTAKNDPAPPFIIRYVSRFLAIEVLHRARIVKPRADLMGGKSSQKIFYNEHLTKKNAEIWKEARKKLWHTHWLWMSNGKVSCSRKEMITQKKVLNSLNDVNAEQLNYLTNCKPYFANYRMEGPVIYNGQIWYM